MKITQKLANFVFPSARSNGKPSDAHRTDLSPNEATNNRCQFTFSDGRQCRNQSAAMCAHHVSRQKRTPLAEGAPDAALEALCGDLTTATNINRALSHVFLLMAQGRIQQKQAVAFGYLTQLLLQTVPGIRSEYVSVHGYQAWEHKLKASLTQNTNEFPDPCPEDGGDGQERSRDTNEQPTDGVAERDKAVPITAPFAHEEVPTSPDYGDLYRRSLNLLDRKYDTTPEGRREANALVLELELLNPAPAKPRQSLPTLPPQETALAETPAASAPPAALEPAFCSSGRGVAQPALRVLSESAAAPPTASHPATQGKPRRPSRRPEPESPHPRPKRELPTPPNRTEHSTDWHAPASWSRPQPDPYPSRREKFKRQLRTMSDRRRQHQMQSRAFWR